MNELERLPILVSKNEKKDFKVKTALNDINMSDAVRTFIRAYNKNPKILKTF